MQNNIYCNLTSHLPLGIFDTQYQVYASFFPWLLALDYFADAAMHNRALLCKFLWRFSIDIYSWWRKVIGLKFGLWFGTGVPKKLEWIYWLLEIDKGVGNFSLP